MAWILSAGCPCPRLKLKDPQCTVFKEDRSALKEFGLKPRIYTGQELVEKIIQYEKKTGCASPRSKKQNKDMMSIFKELSQVFG